MFKLYKQKIEIKTSGQIEFADITAKVDEVIGNSGVREGQVLVYSPHTTAGIVINQNEAMLLQDFMQLLHRLAPVGDRYAHDLFELRRSKSSDGRSNGHSHCKNLLIGVSQTLPVEKGKAVLTERQSIFLAEMDGGRKREVIIQVIGL
jgi:secondary thiamine-phosphate synthase enzyme